MRIVVIGLGNRYRKDDAAGLEVAARIQASQHPGIEVATHAGEPASLMDLWEGTDMAFVVDAVPPNDAPGTTYRVDVSSGPVPDRPRRDSSHTIGLGDTVELARTLGRLPDRLVLIGIEGTDFSAGEGLSPAVLSSARTVADSILGEIEEAAR